MFFETHTILFLINANYTRYILVKDLLFILFFSTYTNVNYLLILFGKHKINLNL